MGGPETEVDPETQARMAELSGKYSTGDLARIPRLRKAMARWQAFSVIAVILGLGLASAARVFAKETLDAVVLIVGALAAFVFAAVARGGVRRRSEELLELQEADIYAELRGTSPLEDHGPTPIWDRPELKVRIRIVAVLVMVIGFFVLSPAEALWEQGDTAGALSTGFIGGGMFLAGLYAWRRTRGTPKA